MPSMTGVKDSGSNYNFGDKMIRPTQRKSQFDLSYINTLTAKQGQLIPVYFSYYYPGDDFNISIESLIRVVNPPQVPLATRQRVFFHLYKIDYTQMWYYFEAFASKGYSGNFETVLPTVSAKLAVDGKINPLLARGSLADFLGFNFSDYTYQSGDENVVVKLPALPFLAYQRIYRDYYFNKNVNIDSAGYKVFLPDSSMDLLIQTKNPQHLTLDASMREETDEPLNRLSFGVLRYRNWVDDYFTSSLPWPMRGDVPTIGADTVLNTTVPVTIPSLPTEFHTIGLSGILAPISYDGSGVYYGRGLKFSADREQEIIEPDGTIRNEMGPPALNIWSGNAVTEIINRTLYSQTDHPARTGTASLTNIPVNLSVTQSALKLLWTNTLISEKLAKTDGTYLQFVETFFGNRPRHASEHMPTYLGGTYQPIVFSQVLQTTPTDNGALGTQGGQGISSSSGHVGRFHADDFGICMMIMSIMPDTYYCQGWHKEHLYQTQDDLPLPERALLGMQPVTQAEIFYDPRDTTGEENQKLFGYQNRLDELRYRANEIHGEIANPNNRSFFPFTQARYFDVAPNLNQEFVSTDGTIRNDWLTAPNEIPYMVQIANRVSAVRQYPYHAPPSALMM